MDDIRREPSYVGEFRHNLDSKKRVTVPAMWRFGGDDQKDQNYFLAFPHPDGYIRVYPPKKREELFAKLDQIRESDRKGQLLLRRLMGKACEFSCDSQGRITLPENLVKHANIKKQVVLVGTGLTFQLWNEESFNTQDDSNLNFLDLMEQVGL